MQCICITFFQKIIGQARLLLYCFIEIYELCFFCIYIIRLIFGTFVEFSEIYDVLISMLVYLCRHFVTSEIPNFLPCRFYGKIKLPLRLYQKCSMSTRWQLIKVPVCVFFAITGSFCGFLGSS